MLEIRQNEAGPDTVVVALAGKLLVGGGGEAIPEMTTEFLRQGKKIVIFDLSGLTAIDSTGIGYFIAGFNQLASAGAQMRMAGATGHLLQSFRVSLLDQVFPFYETVEQASAAGI
jgi:anti-anti-sigma factor